jgi:hypothetical protein
LRGAKIEAELTSLVVISVGQVGKCDVLGSRIRRIRAFFHDDVQALPRIRRLGGEHAATADAQDATTLFDSRKGETTVFLCLRREIWSSTQKGEKTGATKKQHLL